MLKPASRTGAGYRVYSSADEQRLLLIRRMKPLGYTLDEMTTLLDAVDDLTADPTDARTRERFEAFLVEAQQRRHMLRDQLAAADEFVERLSSL